MIINVIRDLFSAFGDGLNPKQREAVVSLLLSEGVPFPLPGRQKYLAKADGSAYILAHWSIIQECPEWAFFEVRSCLGAALRERGVLMSDDAEAAAILDVLELAITKPVNGIWMFSDFKNPGRPARWMVSTASAAARKADKPERAAAFALLHAAAWTAPLDGAEAALAALRAINAEQVAV